MLEKATLSVLCIKYQQSWKSLTRKPEDKLQLQLQVKYVVKQGTGFVVLFAVVQLCFPLRGRTDTGAVSALVNELL